MLHGNQRKSTAQADQDGFALPDRDYYLTEEFKGERAAYRAHLARMSGLLGNGAKKAEAEADAVMRVETALANAAMGLVQRREPKNVHHKMTYDPQMNEINLPAGILQPPNFAMKEDDAANYGNVGVVIGHELTHGFDDEGRHYDAHGNLQDWWTNKDAEAFDARASGLIDEYGAFVAVKDLSRPGEGHTRGWQADAWREYGRQWRHPIIIQCVSDRVRRRDGGQGFLRPHARSALFPQLCAGLVRKQHRRVRQRGRQNRPTLPW